ncbi:MAG TPA: LPS export ABC transporter periplasmic protein LptC [Steroidobacteraceae bacterium]|nr:LPS export ABC transporter periplasmic protein LptC [Steroidobacteraceae bacterium]
MTARILLLAGLLALGAALLQWRLVKPAAPEGPADVQRPGYYLTGVDLEEFGADGKLRIGLQSISATEEPATGVVRLSDVAVDYHAPTGRRWHLTSAEARVPPGGRVVEFEGDVRLTGQPGESPVAAELYTARLSLDTEAETADTRSSVELAFGTHRLRALGMRADLKAGLVHLDSDVSGRFVQ